MPRRAGMARHRTVSRTALLRARRMAFRRFLMTLAILGPGIITAGVDNDAGGITTYSLAGAHFGYGMLWTLIPITIILILVQEMIARMGVVTGNGLADLIRENYGLRTTFWIMMALIVANLANTVAEFAGIAASMEIFHIPKYLSVPLGAVAVWLLVVKGSYRQVERIFLVACAMYGVYIVSGLMARPPWGEVMQAMLVPRLEFQSDYLTMVVGMIGATIAPWMQFYLQAATVEKGLGLQDYPTTRLDVIIGSLITAVVVFFIIVCCAATLYVQGVHIVTAKDAALALQPLAGQWAGILFALGLFNGSLFAAAILPLSTAYSVCEGMGWESGVDKTFREAPHFFSLYTGLIVIGAGLVLIPRAPLITIMYLSQVANGLLLPFILIYMLRLVNDPALMGDHVNPRWYNVIAWTTVVVLIGLTAILVIMTVWSG